ncbi:MAG: hypothetical protein R2911_21740 [Caldilineaceae bacterium]
MTPYDEKVLSVATYGIPMLKVTWPPQVTAAAQSAAPSGAVQAPTLSPCRRAR